MTTGWDLCSDVALEAGHTKEEAEACTNGSLGCPDCPWQDEPRPGALSQSDWRYPHGHWDSLGMPQND